MKLNFKRHIKSIYLTVSFVALLPFVALSDDIEADHDEREGIALTDAQIKAAEIDIITVSENNFDMINLATATLVVDRDKTVTLAPQLEVRVLARHIVPGQAVKKGQLLLTLGGAEVAKAQANYINAASEWNRIQAMDRSVVSGSRYLQAHVDVELSRAILESLKMTSRQIRNLESNPEKIGQYELLSPIDGQVQKDVVFLGQVVSPGSSLLQLTNEDTLWVEAELTSEQTAILDDSTRAKLFVNNTWVEAEIIGRTHEVNNITRTEKLIAKINNSELKLHSGQFAELYLSDTKSFGLILPDTALTKNADGDWQVFLQVENRFLPREVKVEFRSKGLNLVKGLSVNERVVQKGSFFLASELAKSGFDIHGH